MISFALMIILIPILIIFILYSLLIIYYWWSWQDTENFHFDFNTSKKNPQITISVIIPARDEEKNISQLLNRLREQTYPKELYEVIVIDDHSTDRTAEIVRQFSEVRLIQLEETNVNSYKKQAIEKGIAIAKNEFIITTDADCLVPVKWLEVFAAFKEKTNSVFIAAPVSYDNSSKDFLANFQSLDFLVLQGITAAAVHKKLFSMCNGANLGYEKKAFIEVNGFATINNIASGDDMLLMEKIQEKYPHQVNYLRSHEAIVTTAPAQTWREFFNQRIRWASKATHYKNKKIVIVALLVYLANLSLLLLFFLGFWNYDYWFLFLIYLIVKTIIELPFVYAVASFFYKKKTDQVFSVVPAAAHYLHNCRRLLGTVCKI